MFDNIEEYKQHFDELQEAFIRFIHTLKIGVFKYIGR